LRIAPRSAIRDKRLLLGCRIGLKNDRFNYRLFMDGIPVGMIVSCVRALARTENDAESTALSLTDQYGVTDAGDFIISCESLAVTFPDMSPRSLIKITTL